MDEAKRLILARRARFVAAAVAGLSVGACDAKRTTSNAAPDATSSATPPTPEMTTAVTPTSETPMAAENDAGLVAPAVCLLPPGRPLDAAAPPSVKVAATVTTTGNAPNAEAVVHTQLVTRARLCYRRVLADDPKMTGRATFAVKVGSNGEVAQASVTSSAGVSSAVVDCILGAARRLRFDASADGATITTALTFAIEK